MTHDVAVVGGGIIGCAIAHALVREGRRVILLERDEIGKEASWTAGGILTPVHLAEYPGPLAELCVASSGLYPPLADELRQETGIDIEYRPTGMLMLARPGDPEDMSALETLATWKRDRGQPCEFVPHPYEVEPLVAPTLVRGLLMPDTAHVRNNRVAPALAIACEKRGVEIRRHCSVTGFLRVPGRVTGIRTSRGDILAGETIMASGAWSAELLESIGITIDVRPVRGQIVLLKGPPDLVRHMLLWGDRYVVPRADGRLLLGSTIEEAGFEKATTAAGIAGILSSALEIAPGLANLAVEQTWAGLRPATRDRLPYLGRPAGLNGIVLATGHYRNGILLAPVTASIIVDLLADRSSAFDLTPFAIER